MQKRFFAVLIVVVLLFCGQTVFACLFPYNGSDIVATEENDVSIIDANVESLILEYTRCANIADIYLDTDSDMYDDVSLYQPYVIVSGSGDMFSMLMDNDGNVLEIRIDDGCLLYVDCM